MDSTFATLAAAAIRHGLTLAAGALVTQGVITDTQGPELVGIGMTALAFAWSWAQKHNAAKALKLAKGE